jgi:hypothetical protein
MQPLTGSRHRFDVQHRISIDGRLAVETVDAPRLTTRSPLAGAA